ncbi:hypothetical protein [Flavobacterium limnosediminis]|uniref:hypothetical protein n=1 Tax=Flavobacterium limnosediminis TaxID=1401027 RepID=UPI00041F3351|nr:hypothetical protein [Flavobacterium limnosediminis]
MPFYEKEKSKIRMVVLTGHKEENKVFYSPIQENRKPSMQIIGGMLGRLKDKIGKYNVIQFYENNQLIHSTK